MTEKAQFLKVLQGYDRTGDNIKDLMKNAYSEIDNKHNQARLTLKNVYREFEHWHKSLKITIEELEREIGGR